MRKIVYMRADGGMSVVHPNRNTHGEVPGITDAEVEQRAWDKMPADAINPRWVVDGEIPTDRTFRDAWEDAGMVRVNMPKAREIDKTNRRRARVPKLATQDAEFFKALEAWLVVQPNIPPALQAAMVKKQALRDVTADPAIEAAKTPEELIAAWPEILK